MAELESNANYWAVNTWGPNGLVSRRIGSTSTFYTFDERGTTAERLDSTGSVLTAVTGDDYGLCNESNNPNDPFGLFGAQWGYFADETGLYLLGQRYYDKNTARFINQDPIGTAGGINVYGYAGNNPASNIDPSGLQDGPMWYDRLNASVTNWAETAKDYYNNHLCVAHATVVNSLIDFVAGFGKAPAAIGHFGSGFGTYYADPTPQNEAGYYNDLVLGLSVILPIAHAGYVPEIGPEPIFKNPELLRNVSCSKARRMIGSPEGFEKTTLGRGSREGDGMVWREKLPNGNLTGRRIQWHPGGGHHGPGPYWKVSSGPGGTVRLPSGGP